MRRFLFSVALLLLTLLVGGSALADNNGNNNCRANGKSSVGDNCGATSSSNNAHAGAAAIAGSASVSSNRVDNKNKQTQAQGQQQGQVGINRQTGIVRDGDQLVDARDQSTTKYDAPRIPVNSAAPVFSSACGSGMSAQGAGFGGALAKTNAMCDLGMAFDLAARSGNTAMQAELSQRARDVAMSRTNRFRRFCEALPLIGLLF